MRWSACPTARPCAGSARWRKAALPGRRAPPPSCPEKAKPKPRKLVPVTLALVESPAGFLVQQRPEERLLAGLWQPILWEDEHLLQAEVLARLAALGLDTGTAAPVCLPAAKHIFTHIEWLMSGVQLHVPGAERPGGLCLGKPGAAAHHTLPGRSGRISRCCCDFGNLL